MAAQIQQNLHVFDLPQLYQKPPAEALLLVLDQLKLQLPSWDRRGVEKNTELEGNKPAQVNIEGNLTGWLTGIIASPLSWIEDEDLREEVWSAASLRISERCGRSARPAATRKFVIPAQSTNHIVDIAGEKSRRSDLEIILHEPTMEGDNLGLKTWASSYQMATLLGDNDFIEKLVAPLEQDLADKKRECKVLELGSGTGLLGIAAALTLPQSTKIHLTDLPGIVPNLTKNISLNSSSFPSGSIVTGGVLDWRLQASAPTPEDRFNLILSADSIYSKEHPRLVSDVIAGWLEKGSAARCVVGFPARKVYREEFAGFRSHLRSRGLKLLEEGEAKSWDDWGEGDKGQEVNCWWGIFGWSECHESY